MSKNKILFIHHAAGWGGAPNSMIKLINNLDSSKFEASVLLLKNSVVASKLEENGINYSIAKSLFYKKFYQYFTHSEAGYVKWYQLYRFIKRFVIWLLSRYYFARKELSNYDYDIAHLNSSVLTDWLAPASKKGKAIIHIREPYRKGRFDILHPFFTLQMRKYASHIIAISKDNAKRVNIPEKITVIYNYADIPKKPPSENSYFSKKVLYLGGASYIKGFYTLVDALDYLDKDVRVYFGGNYGLSKKKQNIIKRIVKFLLAYGVKKKAAIKKIHNHPNAIVIGLTHNVNKYFDEVCCLVSPFIVPHFARPVIEAHLHKKPVVGSDVEGMDEIIEHEQNGLIVPKNSPRALAKAINELAKNDDKAKMFGETGFNIAIQKFTPKNIDLFEHVYDKALGLPNR